MVTSGPLLPLWPGGWREYRYLCASCGRNGAHTEQFVPFGPGDTPPSTMRLACARVDLDTGAGIVHMPVHLYVLAEPGVTPAKP